MKSKAGTVFIVIIAFAIIAAESFSQTKVSVPDIAGKKPQEITKILGDPTAKETVNPSGTPCPCDKLTYKNGQIEIVFIKGRADWITIHGIDFPIDIQTILHKKSEYHIAA